MTKLMDPQVDTLGMREQAALQAGENLLPEISDGSAAAALSRAITACRDADRLSTRESACSALEACVSELDRVDA
jgi:hypothetical protein